MMLSEFSLCLLIEILTILVYSDQMWCFQKSGLYPGEHFSNCNLAAAFWVMASSSLSDLSAYDHTEVVSLWIMAQSFQFHLYNSFCLCSEADSSNLQQTVEAQSLLFLNNDFANMFVKINCFKDGGTLKQILMCLIFQWKITMTLVCFCIIVKQLAADHLVLDWQINRPLI